MEKTDVMQSINEMLDTYCEGCLVKCELSKRLGKSGSHKFCIEGCTVGSQLQFLGTEMNKITK